MQYRNKGCKIKREKEREATRGHRHAAALPVLGEGRILCQECEWCGFSDQEAEVVAVLLCQLDEVGSQNLGGGLGKLLWIR